MAYFYTHASAVKKSSGILNKNTLGAKNCVANQKQQLNGYTCDQNVWYLAKAKNYTEYKIGNLLYWNAVW